MRHPLRFAIRQAARKGKKMGELIEFVRSFCQSRLTKSVFSVVGVISTLLLYGLLQERVMTSPYGAEKEYMKYSLFIVLCDRVLTSVMVALYMLALKHVSSPVQTLGKCAKMLHVMVWGTLISRKKYSRKKYLVAGLVTVGCAVFLTARETESTFWGIALMGGCLGFDGFTSTIWDKLFKGYNMDTFNQILYTTLFSGVLSIVGLVIRGQWFLAIEFVVRHPACLYDILLLSCAATTSQLFISYTIRTFGALSLATLMTTRQLLSIILSCLLFAHPLTAQQWGAAIVVFDTLYSKTYLSSSKRRRKAAPLQPSSNDLEKEQLLPPIKAADTKASRQHVLDVKECNTRAFRPA